MTETTQSQKALGTAALLGLALLMLKRDNAPDAPFGGGGGGGAGSEEATTPALPDA